MAVGTPTASSQFTHPDVTALFIRVKSLMGYEAFLVGNVTDVSESYGLRLHGCPRIIISLFFDYL
jgi:hypothetical protein